MRLRKSLLFAGVTLLAVSTAYSLEREDISFYLSFENGLQPDIAEGDTEITCSAGKTPDVPFDPAGVRGRGVLLNDALSIRFTNPNMFARQEGTISFWLKPVGWDGDSKSNHDFFYARPANCGLRIYRFWPGNNWAFVQPGGDQKTWRFIGGGWDAWKDGRWQHVAFTFKPGEQTIYFDGQLNERKSTDLFEPVFEDDISITLAKANKGQAQVFDEVILFRRALSEQEIRSLARPPRELTDLLQIPEMKPPTVDGKDTSENEWESANALNDWIDPVLGTVNRDSTEVRVGHSDDKLYVRFLYRIPKIFREQRDLYVGAPLKTDIDQPDGSIFQDDYVGIYLSAPNSQDTCFFGVNGTDTKRDDKNGDPSWNGTWSVRQSRDDHRWIVEFAIPLAAIGADTATGAPWGINFAHGCRQLNHDDGIWHYQPRRQRPLAHMRLATTSTSVHLQGMQSIAQGKFSFQGRIINRDDVPLSAHGRLCIQGADGKPVLETPLGPFSAKPGSAEHFEVEHTLSGPICGKVGLLLEDSAENLLIRKTLPFVYSREMSFFTRYYPSSARLEAVIDAGSSTMLANITSAAISLVPGDGKEPMHMVSIRELNGLQHEETIDCSGIPVGKYEIVADIRTGETATILKDRLEKRALPEWLGNDLGTFQSVPDPYTPLERTDRTVTCWGREYTFGPAGLPAQVRILDKDILASPARLLVTADGQTQTIPLGDFEVSAETGLKMAFSSHAKLEELDVSARAWIEFDGFCHNTITLTSVTPITVQSLAIEIPMKPELATFWSPAEYYPKKLGKSPKTRHMSAVRHGMRVGDEERGLQFTYVNAQRQVLLPRENEYVIRYEFIDKPTKLETPYEMTLAVQGLPVRPRSPIYRLMQVDDCTFTSFAEKERFKIHPLYTEGWSKHWNYHNFWNERAFDPDFIKSFKKGVMERWQTQKQAYCLYVNVTTSDANTPEYRRFRYEWAGKDSTDPMPYAPETKMKRQRVRINPDCPSYIDFYIWHLDKTLRYLTNDGEFPIHLYFDNTDSRRTLFKRVYGVVKKINPLNQIFVHMSGDNNMYAWAFCDWLIEGEENSARYRSYRASNPDLPRDYTHIIDVYKVASRYSPLAFGDKFFLYQFWGWNKTHPEQARKARAHLWSLLFVHDGTTWAAGGPAEKQALVDLGWDDQVEFIPYWRENSGIRVQCEAEPVVASGWKRGPKNLLVMILNDTDTAATGKLSVDFDAFGFTGDTVSADDYGYGGLAYPESFQKEPPKPMEFDSESPLAFEIGRHSYHLVRFHEE